MPQQQKQSINTQLGEIERPAQVGMDGDLMRAIAEANALSSLLGKAAAPLALGSTTRELLQSFRVCTSCNDFKRFGTDSDGGYLTCMDGLNDGVEAALSVGVSSADPWADDFVKQLQKPVAQMDCTVDAGSATEGCSFYKKCLVDQQDGTFPPQDGTVPPQETWTLSDALSGTGHGEAADRSLVLKIDIEGSEWPVFASKAKAQKGLLQKFKQIIAEFHSLHKEAHHEQYLAAMRQLQAAGFLVAHIHGNNFGEMYRVGGYDVPDVLEATLVAGHPRGSCLPDQDVKDLDKPNNPNANELPPARLPTL